MSKKNRISKKTVIECGWFAVSMTVGVILKDDLSLNFGVFICVVVLLDMIGEALIRRFIKINK